VAYRAEIEIGVKGAKQLEDFKNRLQKLGKLVEDTNKKQIFGTAQVTSVNQYNEALSKATDTLNKARLQLDNAGKATKTYKKAIEDYVTALGAANERQEIQSKAIKEEIQLRTEAARAARLQAAGLKDVANAYKGPIGPGQASPTALSSPLPARSRFFGGTQYSGPIGPGQASPILGGQSSPVDVNRLVKAKKEQLELERALFDLARKTAEPLNVQLQLQEGLVAGAREALALAEQARKKQRFLAGSTAGGPQGPLTPAGKTGFPVALPLLKIEEKALELTRRKQQILDRTAQTRRELNGLAQNLQKLETNSVVAIKDANREQQKLNDQKREAVILTERQLKISKQGALLAGKFSPIGGAENIPGSPAFLTARRRRRKDALSSGLIGGAFPLLFGQGAGAAVGGGLGGAAGGLAGGQLGFGLSLVGTALGSAFDNLINKSQELGQALNPLTADLDAVIKAAGLAGTEGEKLIKSIENIAGAEKAQQAAAEQLAVVVGKDGVEALQDLGKASTKLNNELAKSFTALQAAIAPLLANILGFVANRIESTRLVNRAVSGGYQVRPEFAQNQAITGAISQFRKGQIDEFELQKRIAEEVKKQELSLQNMANTQLQKTAGSRNELEQAQLLNAVLKNSSDLTNKTVQQAEEKLILKRMEAKETEIFRRWQKEEITNAQLQLELQALSLETDNERLKLKERIANATKRSADEAERERKERERALKAQRDGVNKALGSAASIKVKDLEFATKRAKFDKTALEAAKVELNQNEAIHAVNKLILEDKYGQAIEDAKSSKEREILIGNYVTEVSLLEDSYKLKQDILKTTIAQKEAEQAIADLKAAAGFDFMSLADRTTPFATGYGQSTGPVGFAEGAQLAPIIQQELAIDRLLEKYKEIGEAAQLAGELVTFGFRDMVSGAKSAEQVFADFLNSLADMLLRTAQQMIAQYIALGIARTFAFGGSPSSAVSGVDLSKNFFSFIPQPGAGGFPIPRANGGPVSGGTPYMVGERGPELFVPRSSGTIVPNDKMMGGSSNVVVNVDASGTKVQGDNDQASQLGRVIGAAVQAELVKQKRPGGLLAGT
jgi:hypothetical protein